MGLKPSIPFWGGVRILTVFQYLWFRKLESLFSRNKVCLKSNYTPKKLSCPLKSGHVKRKVHFQPLFPGGHVSCRRGTNPMFRTTNHPKHPLFVFSIVVGWATQLETYATVKLDHFPPKIGVKPHGNHLVIAAPNIHAVIHGSTDRWDRLSIETSVRQTITTTPKAEHQQCSHITRCLVETANQFLLNWIMLWNLGAFFFLNPLYNLISTENLFKLRALSQMNQVIAPSTIHFFHPTQLQKSQSAQRKQKSLTQIPSSQR